MSLEMWKMEFEWASERESEWVRDNWQKKIETKLGVCELNSYNIAMS